MDGVGGGVDLKSDLTEKNVGLINYSVCYGKGKVPCILQGMNLTITGKAQTSSCFFYQQ